MAKTNREYKVAKKLVGGEIPEWRFEQQLTALINIITDVHQARPLMKVNDILKMILDTQLD